MKPNEELAEPEFNNALILAGGGAKGAYQWGCLKAIRKFRPDLRFDAVVGTSVGALNAAMWATGSHDEGEKLWSNLSFENTYARRLIPERMPKLLRVSIGLAFTVLQLFIYNMGRFPLGDRRLERFLDIATASFATAGTATLVCWLGGTSPEFIVIASVSLATAVAVLFLSKRRDNESDYRLVLILGCLCIIIWLASILKASILMMNGVAHLFLSRELVLVEVTILFGLIALAIGLLASKKSRRLLATATGASIICLGIPGSVSNSEISMALWFWLPMMLSAIFLMMISADLLITLDSYVRNVVLFDRRPLEAQLYRILSERSFTIPVWVTTAERVKIWDVQNPWCDLTSTPIRSDWHPVMLEKWIPRYEPLHGREIPTAVELCLASAALPFGIVPPVTIEGSQRVDGGIVDNIPVFPMIGRARRLFVFTMESPHLKGTETQLEILAACGISPERWAEIARLLDLASLEVPSANSAGVWVDRSDLHSPEIPERTFPGLPEIFLFHPSKPVHKGGWGKLSNWISGTLNFDPVFAQEFIKLGFEETSARLEKLNI